MHRVVSFVFAIACLGFAPFALAADTPHAHDKPAAPACALASADEAKSVADATSIRIGGAVSHPYVLDATRFAALPRHEVSFDDHGTRATWQGIALIDALCRAGVPTGPALRGKSLALVVRVTAGDGYVAAFALAELDPALHAQPVILADRRDGQPLDAKHLPYRLVSSGDLRPARSVRQVVAIEVIDTTSH